MIFPENGCFPRKYEEDVDRVEYPAEDHYWIFGSPSLSVTLIDKIQSERPRGCFKPVPKDHKHLPRTFKKLTEGGDLHILGLGDSIVNDTMRSAWVAKLRQTSPPCRKFSKGQGFVCKRIACEKIMSTMPRGVPSSASM